MLRYLFILILIVIQTPLLSGSAVASRTTDREILEVFFRHLIRDSEMGYVLQGVKPMAWLGCDDPRSCWSPVAEYAKPIWALSEGARVWPKYQNPGSNIQIRVWNHPNEFGHRDVVVVNKSAFKDVFEQHRSLFRYVLGPTLTADKLLEDMLRSDKSVNDILSGDQTLIGLLLGFGETSSLVGGRVERIQSVQDLGLKIPGLQKPLLRDDSFLPGVERSTCDVEWLYSQPEYQISTIDECHHLSPKQAASIEAELSSYKRLSIPLKPSLHSESPRFVFGPYLGDETDQLMGKLEQAQRWTQKVLNDADFLEQVLSNLAVGPISDSATTQATLISGTEPEQLVARAMWEMCMSVEEPFRKRCVSAILEEGENSDVDYGWHPFGTSLTGARKIGDNIARAERFLAARAIVDGARQLQPGKLFYHTICEGNGESMSGNSHVLVSYSTSDDEGNRLSAGHMQWIDSDLVLPSVLHAVQGMKEGERRRIYIHPSLGYGIDQWIKSGTALVVEITLHGFKGKQTQPLPPLVETDLSFIRDEAYLGRLERDLAGMYQTLAGGLAKGWMQSADLQFERVLQYLNELSEGTLKFEELSEPEANQLAMLAWNLCFGQPA